MRSRAALGASVPADMRRMRRRNGGDGADRATGGDGHRATCEGSNLTQQALVHERDVDDTRASLEIRRFRAAAKPFD